MKTKKMTWSAGLLMMVVLAGGVNSASANLLLNGSFEEPVLGPDQDRTSTVTNWVDATYDRVAKGSLYGGAPDGNQLAEVIGMMVQSPGIQLVAGTTYKLTFLTRDMDPAVDSENVGCIYMTDTSTSTNQVTHLASKAVETDTTWASGECQFTCDPTQAGKYMVVMLGTTSWSGYSLFDNVVLTPEPASMFLLATGGLMMLRRRGQHLA